MISIWLSWIMFGGAFIAVIIINGPYPSAVVMNGVALTFICAFDQVILSSIWNEVKLGKVSDAASIFKKDLTKGELA